MNTTELIKLLQEREHGASGRSREISLSIQGDNGAFLPVPIIEVSSTGDGICGAEICLMVTPHA